MAPCARALEARDGRPSLTAAFAVCRNYSVHAVMYTYFLLTALPACRERVLRFAPLITSLQISQFAWGTVINVYAAVSYFTPSVGCAIRPQILQIGALMYLLYGALFVHLFWRRYIRPAPRRRPVSAKEDELLEAAPGCRPTAAETNGVNGSGRHAGRDADLLLKVV